MTKVYSLIFWVFAVGTVSIYPHVAIADNFQNIGVVDSFAISSTSGDLEFTAAGWVGAGKPESGVISLIVELGSDVIYEGRFERFERPDVVTATGRKDWLRSGWRVTASIPTSKKMASMIFMCVQRLMTAQLLISRLTTRKSKN